eukprot:TRINITY_DN8947_c0_g1_i3.p2 TRINITY_DN8947_c0_g1~~TRINITY_DN8947_c0_g1_i3.p2  ORF type:complete len:103 (-),score=1.00 TRINITY_DN8947_c0_g1_i3:16-324(-)
MDTHRRDSLTHTTRLDSTIRVEMEGHGLRDGEIDAAGGHPELFGDGEEVSTRLAIRVGVVDDDRLTGSQGGSGGSDTFFFGAQCVTIDPFVAVIFEVPCTLR